MLTLLRTLTLSLLLATFSQTQANDLISVETLQNLMKQPHHVLIDLRSPEVYAQGHLPHAVNLPYAKLTRQKDGIEGFIQTPQAFQKALESVGISPEDTVILYSDWAFLESTRIYWALDFYGHAHKKVLDGGIQAWVNANLPLSTAKPQIEPSRYAVSIHPEKLSSKLQTFMASQNQEYVIVDARPLDQYQGKTSLTERKGHIPGAMNMPWYEWVENRQPEEGYDKTSEATLLANSVVIAEKIKNLPEGKKIILYCNGGQESSVVYFALKQAGIQTSVYDGSWFEWSQDQKLPVTNPSSP